MSNELFGAAKHEPSCSAESLSTDEFLSLLGLRIRTHRTAKSMSRKKLAESSGVSERYLAQLESGQGNMSIALLRKVAVAIGLPLDQLLAEVDRQAATTQAVKEVAEYS